MQRLRGFGGEKCRILLIAQEFPAGCIVRVGGPLLYELPNHRAECACCWLDLLSFCWARVRLSLLVCTPKCFQLKNTSQSTSPSVYRKYGVDLVLSPVAVAVAVVGTGS